MMPVRKIVAGLDPRPHALGCYCVDCELYDVRVARGSLEHVAPGREQAEQRPVPPATLRRRRAPRELVEAAVCFAYEVAIANVAAARDLEELERAARGLLMALRALRDRAEPAAVEVGDA